MCCTVIRGAVLGLYGHLSPSFVVSSGVGKTALYPHFYLTIMEDVLHDTFSGLLDGGVELFPGKEVFDLEYANDIALLCNDAHARRTAWRLSSPGTVCAFHLQNAK